MSIVGSGDFKYELVDSWPKMPKYWEFTIASDVYVNSKDCEKYECYLHR